MKWKMNQLDWAAWMLVLVGAVNWLFVGVAKWDLVEMTFGTNPLLAQILYILIGVSGIYWIFRTIFSKK